MELLRRLSRVTSSGRYIPEVDGLRFVAIAAVFIHHVNTFVALKSGLPATGYAENLHYGVQLFFTISGFILAWPFASHYLAGAPEPEIGKYYLRRVTRIEPPYVINLLLVFAIQGGSGGLGHLAASMGYLHNVVYGRFSDVNPVAWSLEIEVQFYLLAPLLFRVFGCSRAVRRSVLAIVATAAIAVQYRWPDARIDLSLIGQAQYFIAGMFLADFYVDSWRGKARTFGWDAVSCFGWAGAAYAIQNAAGPYVLCVLILLACCGAFRGRAVGWVLRQPVFATIGGMCYTIYLYHYLFIAAIGRFTLPWSHSVAVQTVVLGIPTVIGCSVLFLVSERPFMRSAKEKKKDALPAVDAGAIAVGWNVPGTDEYRTGGIPDGSADAGFARVRVEDRGGR